METWTQVYDPLGHWLLSAIVAAIPILVLFYLLAVKRTSVPIAAGGGALAAILIAIFVCGMPTQMATAAFLYGAAFGLMPIGYVVFSALFLYQISLDSGQFEIMRVSIGSLTTDRRLQALLIAFSFGALVEGAAGFGTPVAVSAALMVGLGFQPFYAAALCLIANTAPVAYGSLGTPLLALEAASGLPLADLSAMNARILPLTSVIIPLWLVRCMVGWKETREVMPAIWVSGISFAITQFVWGNYVDARLVDIVGGFVSLIATAAFLKVWKPKNIFLFKEDRGVTTTLKKYTTREVFYGWAPFIILGVFVLLWGFERGNLNGANLLGLKGVYQIPVPYLDKLVARVPPVVAANTQEPAVYAFNWLSATGTGVLIAAVFAAILARFTFKQFLDAFMKTFRRMEVPLLAIAPMLGLGYLTRYSGMDAILGLAFTTTGWFYPFFAAMLGWLGVALTGSDTSSNTLFGGLQRITAEQLGLDPVLTCAANSAGGVMGKMVDAQSIVVASTATNQVGNEGAIFRFVMWHSLVLASIIGVIVMMYAYVFPQWVPHNVEFLMK